MDPPGPSTTNGPPTTRRSQVPTTSQATRAVSRPTTRSRSAQEGANASLSQVSASNPVSIPAQLPPVANPETTVTWDDLLTTIMRQQATNQDQQRGEIHTPLFVTALNTASRPTIFGDQSTHFSTSLPEHSGPLGTGPSRARHLPISNMPPPASIVSVPVVSTPIPTWPIVSPITPSGQNIS